MIIIVELVNTFSLLVILLLHLLGGFHQLLQITDAFSLNFQPSHETGDGALQLTVSTGHLLVLVGQLVQVLFQELDTLFLRSEQSPLPGGSGAISWDLRVTLI